MAARLAIRSQLKHSLSYWWRRVSNVCHTGLAVVVFSSCWQGEKEKSRGREELQEFKYVKRGAERLLHEKLLTALLLRFFSNFYSSRGGCDLKISMTTAQKEAPLYRPTPQHYFLFCSTLLFPCPLCFCLFSWRKKTLWTKIMTSTSLSLKMSFVASKTVTMT